MNAKQLYEFADRVFGKKLSLTNLHQEIAMNFYPERADFTYQRSLGTDFASNLMTSYPLLVRRELGDQIGMMLRPNEKPWFYMSILDEQLMDNEVRQWLEWKTTVMRRAMYDKASNFTKAEKQADHDFATFGGDVISCQMNKEHSALQYNCWHLRDCAWTTDENDDVNNIFRRWKPFARDLVRIFPRTCAKVVQDAAVRDPTAETNCVHMVVPADHYDGKKVHTPYVSIFYDIANDVELEVTPSFDMIYSVERWLTVSGSQYPFSPASVAALPEARLLQAMTYTILEASEKATNPPMIADQNIFRTDVAMYAGGITWADFDGDGKLADYLHLLTNDKAGIPVGESQQDRCMKVIADAFYLNSLRPFNPGDPQMTAFEAGQRVQDYIRKALPLFEPMEDERNASICELTWGRMMRAGAFGPTIVMPRKLRQAIENNLVQFRFRSPLHDSIEQMKGTTFMQMKQLTAEAVGMDPKAQYIPNAIVALRDALAGIGVQASWLRGESEVADLADEQDQAAQTERFLAAAQGGADVAKTISESQKNVAGAQQPAVVQ